jgi:hypothetical protein
MLTQPDICELKRLAKNYLIGYPSRARIKGNGHDITFEDFRVLAIYEATLTFLHSNGILSYEKIEEVKPEWTPIEETDNY